MKTLVTELAYFLRGRTRQNLRALVLYGLFLAGMILVYAVVFRFLMWHLEGREFSLIAGIYWTITVMTTLGFGDITFHSDLGYVFAALVTISGVVFLLIILPFGMISMFLAPWIEHRLANRLTQELPKGTAGHVVIFGFDAITRVFVDKLRSRQITFVIVSSDADETLRLRDEGLPATCGTPADPELITSLRVDTAQLIICNLSDPENVTICLTVRRRCETPITAFVDSEDHISLVRAAGANRVIPLYKITGRYLAIRATTCGAMAHILDSIGELQIAEIPVYGTPFAGKTLEQAKIRQQTGLAVIGIWERGVFAAPTPDMLLNENALLVLSGTHNQLERLEQLTGESPMDDLVFILGHGRIGCAAARFLESKPVPFILIDQKENKHCTEHIPIYGDATVGKVLTDAGIDRAKGLIATTNDDNINIFLTLAIRQLLPHIRLVARANREENVAQLYLAGADFVVSNASVGASILLNILEAKASLFLTEGIHVFRRAVPNTLAGLRIAESRLRAQTGCTIVAIEGQDGTSQVSPPPETVLEKESTLILIGTSSQEELFDKTLNKL